MLPRSLREKASSILKPVLILVVANSTPQSSVEMRRYMGNEINEISMLNGMVMSNRKRNHLWHPM